MSHLMDGTLKCFYISLVNRKKAPTQIHVWFANMVENVSEMLRTMYATTSPTPASANK